jgi:hypothetical protein
VSSLGLVGVAEVDDRQLGVGRTFADEHALDDAAVERDLPTDREHLVHGLVEQVGIDLERLDVVRTEARAGVGDQLADDGHRGGFHGRQRRG